MKSRNEPSTVVKNYVDNRVLISL